MLMGPNVVRSQSVRKGGKTYRYELDPPRRYYQCYGMRTHRLRCREHPVIRAERLEELVWGEVRRVLEQPELIAAGLAALDPAEDHGIAGDVARSERELERVQLEEDRAIRLYVSGKIQRGATRPPAALHRRAAGAPAGEAGRVPGEGIGAG